MEAGVVVVLVEGTAVAAAVDAQVLVAAVWELHSHATPGQLGTERKQVTELSNIQN